MKTNLGIYRIVNLIDNKIYIGSSINLKSRKYLHYKLLSENKHPNSHLQSAYNRDGRENFKWEVLKYVIDPEDKKGLKRILLEHEQYYLDFYKSYNDKIGYNICKKADSCLGIKRSRKFKEKLSKLKTGNKNWSGKKHTKETKEKMRISSIGNKNRSGKKHSDETKRKIGNKNKISKLGFKHTEESRQRMIDNSTCKKRVKNITTNKIFESIKEASVYYNVDPSSISKVCRGIKNSCGGFMWSYI